MRRVLLAAIFVASGLGIFALPAAADNSSPSFVILSFDFSDNSVPAAVSTDTNGGFDFAGISLAAVAANDANGAFNVIADVLPEQTGGYVRMVAIAPDNSGSTNLVCPFQPVQQSQVECGFNFTADGVWNIKAQFAPDTKSDVTSVTVTSLRVTN